MWSFDDLLNWLSGITIVEAEYVFYFSWDNPGDFSQILN